MKTIEEKAKAYDEAIERAAQAIKDCGDNNGRKEMIRYIFPELKESEDERIRKVLIESFDFLNNGKDQKWGRYEEVFIDDIIAWLEKQGHNGKKWIYEDTYNKEKEQVYQDGIDDVLENPQKYGLEKQGGVSDPRCNILNELLVADDIYQMSINDKMVQEAKAKAIDALSKLEIYKLLNIEKQGEQKPADKIEPKFHEGEWVVSPNGVYWHIDTIRDNRYEVSANTGQCANWPLDTNIYHLWSIQDAKDGDVLAYSV